MRHSHLRQGRDYPPAPILSAAFRGYPQTEGLLNCKHDLELLHLLLDSIMICDSIFWYIFFPCRCFTFHKCYPSQPVILHSIVCLLPFHCCLLPQKFITLSQTLGRSRGNVNHTMYQHSIGCVQELEADWWSEITWESSVTMSIDWWDTENVNPDTDVSFYGGQRE